MTTKTIYGKIEGILFDPTKDTGTTAQGGIWKKYTYVINVSSDLQKYSCFDRKIQEQFKIGDFVKLQLEDKVKGEKTYWNMISMETASPEDNVETVTPEKPGETMAKPSHTNNRQAAKQVALKCAVKVCENKKLEGDVGVLNIADGYFNWIMDIEEEDISNDPNSEIDQA